MTVSPDLPGFQAVDVTQLDVTDPADLVDLALERASVLLPDWSPREGNVEVVLLEEFAVLVALLATRLEEVVPAVTSQILELSGLARDRGTPARVQVQVDMSDTLGHIVPAGTSVVLGDPNAEDPVTGTLLEDVATEAGSATGTGVIVMDAVGEVEGLSTVTEAVLIDAVPYVDLLTITSVLSPGTSPETQDAFLARGSAWLSAMTQLLGRADQFAARALTDARVGRAIGVQRWDGSEAAPGEVLGWVTVLALSATGQALDEGALEELRGLLGTLAAANVNVAMQSPVVTTVDVEATITLLPGNVASDVVAAATAAVSRYLSPLAWPWGEALRVSRLQQVIETTTGVDAVVSLTPSTDIELGDYDLLAGGTITVTVA